MNHGLPVELPLANHPIIAGPVPPAWNRQNRLADRARAGQHGAGQQFQDRDAQRPGTEAIISEIHRQSTVGMPTTARATMPPSGDEDPLLERWAYALPAGPSSAPAEPRADPHTVDRRCREARMSRP